MKLKALLTVACLGLVSAGYAADFHVHAGAEKAAKSNQQGATSPGYCQIEIINDTFDDLNVYGRFDDNSALIPFVMKYRSAAQYVSLYYAGYCHQGMDFYIETTSGKFKYNGFTPVGKTIKVTQF